MEQQDGQILRRTGREVLECVALSPAHRDCFGEFWAAIEGAGETRFFLPHPIDEKGREAVLAHEGKDIYLALLFRESMVGYGLLRGWEEG